MAFTGILGTGASSLGGFVLGSGDGGTPTHSVGASNTLALSQTVSVSVTYHRSVSHMLTLSCVVGQSYPVNASNTLTFSQHTEVINHENTQIGNTLVFSQLATTTKVYNRSAANTLTMSQSTAANARLNRSASNTITFSQAAFKVLDGVASNTITFTQLATVVKYRNAGANNSLVLTQAVHVELTTNRTVQQTLVLAQTATKQMYFNRPVSSILSLSQSASGVASKLAKNVLTFSQTATCEYVHGTRNTIIMTQSVGRLFTAVRSMHSNFIPFQTVVVNGTFRRTLESMLNLIQTVTVQVVRPASNHINFTQSVDVVNSKAAKNTLHFVQSAYTNYTVGKQAKSELILTHVVSVQKSRAIGASNAFGMNQFARATKIIHVNASNTLVLSQDLVRERFNRTVPQTLALSQSAIGVKHAARTVSQHLALSHSVSVSKTIVRSVGNVLVFKNSFQKYIALNGGTTILVPIVQVVKVESLVILQSDTSVIVLKAPEFGDSEAGANRINIKRSMDGDVRIYKRQSPTTKLTYNFVMDRKKAIELRSFILENNSKIIRMTNWKGEIWIVNLTNNPFSFHEEARWESAWGNRSSVTLEFEGVRIN